MPSLVGQQLGKFTLLDRLGRGGMAEVYRAMHPSLGHGVAIKVLHSHLTDDVDFLARFEREAQSVARLNHPHIVRVYDFETSGDVSYMVMEYLPGETLSARVARLHRDGQRLTIEEVLSLLERVSSAVDHAHAQGIVHRDLKPTNIMYNDAGEPILTDFGIARIAGGAKLTQTGFGSGTPAYLSPEQATGEDADARSDVYSLGIVAYELLAGVVPFEAETPFGVVMQHVSAPPPSLVAIMPHLPEAIDRVLARALAKRPDDRYQTAAAFSRDLRSALGGTATVTPAPPAVGRSSHRPVLIGLVATAIVTAIVALLVGRSTPPDRSQAREKDATEPAVSQTSSMAASPYPDDVRFADDFSDPSSGWRSSDGPDSRGYASGEYRIRETTPSVAVAELMAHGPRFHSFHAAVDAILHDGQPESGYGLVFGHQDPQNYYVFGVNGFGQVSMWALTMGVWRELRNLPDRQLWTRDERVKLSGEVNRLEVIRTGSRIVGRVNGSVVISLEDRTFTFGGIGFYVASSTNPAREALVDVRFDNLTIDPVVPSMAP